MPCGLSTNIVARVLALLPLVVDPSLLCCIAFSYFFDGYAKGSNSSLPEVIPKISNCSGQYLSRNVIGTMGLLLRHSYRIFYNFVLLVFY